MMNAAERHALEFAHAVIADMVYLYRVNRGVGSSPTVRFVESTLRERVESLDGTLRQVLERPVPRRKRPGATQVPISRR